MQCSAMRSVASLAASGARQLRVGRSSAHRDLATRFISASASPEQQHGQETSEVQPQQQQQQQAVHPRYPPGATMMRRSSPLTMASAMFPAPFRSAMREMEDMLQMVEDSFFGVPSSVSPSNELAMPKLDLAIDVQETDDAFVLKADVPGVTKEDVKVTVSPDNLLTISGERRSEAERTDEASGMRRIERSYGSFSRAFRLPANVDAAGVTAKVADGVLTVAVPKTAQEEHREVQVAVE